MTENTTKGTTGEPPTPWQRRTASFQQALLAGWRSYRLVPWLFKHAGRAESVSATIQAFGGSPLFPTTDFSLERVYGIDGMGREWGAEIARGETAAFITRLAEHGAIDPASDQLVRQLYRVRVGPVIAFWVARASRVPARLLIAAVSP